MYAGNEWLSILPKSSQVRKKHHHITCENSTQSSNRQQLLLLAWLNDNLIGKTKITATVCSIHSHFCKIAPVYLRRSSSSIRQRSSLIGPQVMASLQRSSTAVSRSTVRWMPPFWRCSRSSTALGHRSENSN